MDDQSPRAIGPNPNLVLVEGDFSAAMDIEPHNEPQTPSPAVSQLPLSSPMKRSYSSESNNSFSKQFPADEQFKSVETVMGEPDTVESGLLSDSMDIFSPSGVPIPESPLVEAMNVLPKEERVLVEPVLGGVAECGEEGNGEQFSVEQVEKEKVEAVGVELTKQPFSPPTVKLEAPSTSKKDSRTTTSNLGRYTFHGVQLTDCDLDFNTKELTTAEQLSYSRQAFARPPQPRTELDEKDAGYTEARQAILDTGLDPDVIPKLLELKRAIERNNAIQREVFSINKQIESAAKRLESAQHAFTLTKTSLKD